MNIDICINKKCETYNQHFYNTKCHVVCIKNKKKYLTLFCIDKFTKFKDNRAFVDGIAKQFSIENSMRK